MDSKYRARATSDTRRSLVVTGFLMTAWTLLPLQTVTAQPAGRRVAFVIGNARYAGTSALLNPHNDARLIADLLRQDLRFDEVVEHRDLDRTKMFDLVTQVQRKARGADAVLVYYSGHGMRGPAGNYLIPVDARITEEEHVRRDAVPAQDLVEALQSSGARVALLILDACRDSPFARRTRSLTKGLARMNVSGGNLLVAYATTDGQVAEDGGGSHSPYALALAQHLRDTSKPVMKQFDLVRASTRQATANRQNPTREGDLEVDVMLVDPRATVALAPAAVPAPVQLPAVASPTPAIAQPGSGAVLLVRIGHVAPMSGPLAHLGQDNDRGAQLAIEELNARSVVIGDRPARFELVTMDDGADPKLGTQAAQRLVDQRVSAVVGHLNSGTSIPASAVYSKAGIPQISPASTNPRYTRQGFPTTFRVLADDQSLGESIGVHAVQSMRASSIAVVDDRTAYGQGVADAFEAGVKRAGGRIVAREYTNDNATDFTAILTRLKAKRPDLIFVGGMDAIAGPMLRQMNQLGIQAKMIGGDGICSQTLPQLAAGSMQDGQVVCAEAGTMPTQPSAAMVAFRERFKRRFNTEPLLYAPNTYDSVMLIADAMVRARSSAAGPVLQALRSSQYGGISGPIRFDSKGDIVQGSVTLYTYVQGKRNHLTLINAGS